MWSLIIAFFRLCFIDRPCNVIHKCTYLKSIGTKIRRCVPLLATHPSSSRNRHHHSSSLTAMYTVTVFLLCPTLPDRSWLSTLLPLLSLIANHSSNKLFLSPTAKFIAQRRLLAALPRIVLWTQPLQVGPVGLLRQLVSHF